MEDGVDLERRRRRGGAIWSLGWVGSRGKKKDRRKRKCKKPGRPPFCFLALRAKQFHK